MKCGRVAVIRKRRGNSCSGVRISHASYISYATHASAHRRPRGTQAADTCPGGTMPARCHTPICHWCSAPWRIDRNITKPQPSHAARYRRMRHGLTHASRLGRRSTWSAGKDVGMLQGGFRAISKVQSNATQGNVVASPPGEWRRRGASSKQTARPRSEGKDTRC